MKIPLLLTPLLLCLSAWAEDYQAWTVTCPTAKPCVISQMVMKQQGDAADVIAGVSYFNHPSQPILKIRITPQADPKKGLGLKFDQQTALHLPITNCDNKVCEVNIVADQQLIDDLQNSKLMSVAYILKSNQQQNAFPVILNGFKQAYLSIQ
ncbi:invasion associated locus B family protein [Agarivorans sp.]|uniref:invasion associated locus B family protein n=1 Tax=Agarivorans sp. TaxID=1872412 RepID=UPI003CFCA557